MQSILAFFPDPHRDPVLTFLLKASHCSILGNKGETKRERIQNPCSLMARLEIWEDNSAHRNP